VIAVIAWAIQSYSEKRTYDESKSAITPSPLENERAALPGQRANPKETIEAQQKRRNVASIEYAGAGAGIGAFLGAIVVGLAGCVSCINNHTSNDLITDFNLFSGAWYGAIGGALIGAIIGALIGQAEN